MTARRPGKVITMTMSTSSATIILCAQRSRLVRDVSADAATYGTGGPRIDENDVVLVADIAGLEIVGFELFNAKCTLAAVAPSYEPTPLAALASWATRNLYEQTILLVNRS